MVTVAKYSGAFGRRKKKIIINASDGKRAAERVKSSGEVLSVRKMTLQEVFNLNRKICVGNPKEWFGTSEDWKKV